MVIKKPIILVLLVFSVVTLVNAQFQLPQFDVELKVQQNIIPFSGGEYLNYFETTNLYSAAHVQVGQHLAIGGFYSRSFRGTERFSYKTEDVYHDALNLTKGIEIRFSTGRAKKWRKYIALNYSQIEIVEDNIDYRLASKTNAFGGSLGIMRKLSNKLYLTIIELGVKALSDEIFWFNSSDKLMIDAKMGLLYNIGKKK